MHNNRKKTVKVFQYRMLGLAVLGSQFFHAQITHLDSINISSVEKNIRLNDPYISFFSLWIFRRQLFSIL
ncbi:hypothetical protein [Chryseobacterium carnipullorum]|nr:hypothetical protein [Chryseobacterium carnipullorum]